eukprot:m.119983 g.119983  ORF g.119983 m.119983 type:complete len:884 (-) comp21823_c0_seq10:587-3238(-)
MSVPCLEKKRGGVLYGDSDSGSGNGSGTFVHPRRSTCVALSHASNMHHCALFGCATAITRWSQQHHLDHRHDLPGSPSFGWGSLQIWSALEERNFFRAAIMYVTSKFIFDGVRNERDSTNRRLLKSFPILFRQWDSIQPFKENITRTAREFFLSPQPDDAAVAALAAVMVVDQLSVTAALQWYLDVKSESVSAALAAVPLGQGLVVEPTDKICAVIRGIAQTVRQLHTLFGQSGAADDDDDAADAGDAGLGKVGRFLRRAVSANRAEDGGAAGGLFLSQAMPASVRDFRPPLATGALDKIPADTLQATCGGWFRGLIPTVEEGAGRVLRQVEAVVGVVTVRDAIWTLLGQEYATLAPGITVSIADDAGPWGVLCRRVLGKETELWGTLLQQSVMHRAQTVLTSMFRVAVEAAFSTATTYTAAIAAGEVEVAEESNVGENLWGHRKAPEGGHATQQQQQQPQQQHAKGDDAGALAAAVGLASCPPSVRQVVEGLTVALANVLEQSRVLLEEARDTTPRGLSDPPPPFEKCGDAIELRRFLQAACEKCVDDFVANVDTEVAAILSKEGGAANAGANAVDQILFLGRVCRAVVLHANEVQQLMLLPAGGKGGHLDGKFVARTRRAAQRRAAPTEHDTRLAAVRDKLLAACGRCHAVWTSRISHDRAVEFRRRLLEHDWAGVVVEKRTWQRHTVEEETEAGGKLESVVRLPSQASSYVLTLLCNACAEVSRVGGHTVATETIGALADALYDECVVGYTELLNGPTRKALSQDALLQILFDLYFVGDVLLGSAPPAAGGPGQRHVHFGDLVNQVLYACACPALHLEPVYALPCATPQQIASASGGSLAMLRAGVRSPPPSAPLLHHRAHSRLPPVIDPIAVQRRGRPV